VQVRERAAASVLLALVLLMALAAGCSEAQTSTSTVDAPGASSNEPSSGLSGGAATSDTETPADEPSDSVDFDAVPANVTRVVDGDTAVMTLRGGSSERVRFIGVDTPESTTQHEPYGEEASAFTKQRLTGKQVWLQIGTEQRDKYGRLLAYVWLEPPADASDAELRAKQFNAQLLLEGYAQLLTIPPNTDYVDQYRKFQAEARDANRGLWGLSTAGSSAVPVPAPGAGTAGGSNSGSSANYIGNRNSKKFHYADCRYVGEMNPENKVPFATREAAISAGYVPCKVCKP